MILTLTTQSRSSSLHLDLATSSLTSVCSRSHNLSTDSLRWLNNAEALEDSAEFMRNVEFEGFEGVDLKAGGPAGTKHLYYGGRSVLVAWDGESTTDIPLTSHASFDLQLRWGSCGPHAQAVP